MAITNSDGSIVLTTRIEDAGLKKGMAKIISDQKTQLQSLTREYAKLITNNKQNTEEAEKLKDQIDKLSKSIKENEGVLQSFEKTSTGAFSRVGNALKSIAGYLALAFSVTKIIQFSNEAGQLATQNEASVQRLVDIYGSASDSVANFIDQNSKALGLSKSVGASIASTYGNLLSVWADQETNAKLTNALLNQTAVVASRTGRTTTDVAERVRSGLLGNTEAIEDLGINVNIKTIEITDAFKRIADGRSWEQLNAYEQAQVRTLAILEQSTNKYGTTVADTSATIRNRFNAAYQDFQNAWGNIVNTVLLPVLETLTQIFDIATKGLNALSGRSGKILENVELQEENTDKTAENIEEQTKNQKKLNNEIKKTLAGFDDIQILSAGTAETTQPPPNLNILGGGDTTPDGSAYVEKINEILGAIMKTVAVSMIAIGLILLFTGHAGWGISTIIFGVALEGVTVASITQADPSTEIINSLLALQGVAVGASVALGIMMIFMGSKGLGVGLIAYGAVQLGVTIYEITQFDTSPIESTINTIQGIAAGAMLALGFFLLYFKANMPLAISLIAGGALLVVDEIFNIVEGGVSPEISAWINGIMLILEGAALVIGIILLATGVNIPLGISLVATGAFALGKEVAANWNAIVEALRGPIGAITALVGESLLVIGILVCFVNLPLGIALIATGAVALVTPIALNWDAIVGWISGAWNAVKGFWNKNIAPVFTARFWLDLGKTCINGLIAGFEAGVNGIIWLFESMINFIVDGINSIGFDIPDWLGGGRFGFNLSRVKFDRLSIPRLAQGAVIPPNREFLAVLGDNKKENEVVSPVSTMKQAFMEAMMEMGGNLGGGNTEVVLEIDGREFGRAVVEQGNRENRRIGTRLVIG